MVINEFRYKLKPGADVDELLRLFNELALPVYSKIPGFISMGVIQLDFVTLGLHSVVA